MGYYTIRLYPHARKLCQIVSPLGAYEYLRLPMGIMESPDIFQEQMSNLFHDIEFVRACLDDLLVITKGTFEEHLRSLETILQRLQEAGLKVNAEKSAFGVKELEYLGYWLTPNGIKPLANKIEAIHKLARPKNEREMLSILGFVNFYREMWKSRSHIRAPLSNLLKKENKYQLEEQHEKAFNKIKEIINKEVMLAFPNFAKKFTLHTDTSALQLGAVIIQEDKPIAFYSRKLTDTQKRYGVGEIELLSVVETLKEFRSILLGQKIEIYTDHLNNVNLTPNNKLGFNRIQRWRWLLEEFGPEFKYLPGERNRVADALARIERMDDEVTSPGQVFAHIIAHVDSNQIDSVEDDIYRMLRSIESHEVRNTEQSFPLNPNLIKLRQEKKNESDRDGRPTCYGRRDRFITYNDKIYVPKSLRRQIFELVSRYALSLRNKQDDTNHTTLFKLA